MIPTMTPSGVEHITLAPNANRVDFVIPTMTPSGVEHNSIRAVQTHDSGDPDDDAFGR